MKVTLPFRSMVFGVVSLCLTSGAVVAQEQSDALPASLSAITAEPEATLEDFRWTHRPVIVFADSPNDPRFSQQMDLLAKGVADLADRDVIVLTDTDTSILGPLRKKLRPRGFMLVLIGKDGGIKLRKPLPWDARELSRVIDKMPMRQREVRDRRGK